MPLSRALGIYDLVVGALVNFSDSQAAILFDVDRQESLSLIKVDGIDIFPCFKCFVERWLKNLEPEDHWSIQTILNAAHRFDWLQLFFSKSFNRMDKRGVFTKHLFRY